MTAPTTIFPFHVNVHGIPLELRIPDFRLYQALGEFFPKSWQRVNCESLVVDWRAPLLPERWDAISSPDCEFFGSFVSQRDFMVKKLDARTYQLIAHLAIDDGFFNFLRYLLPTQLMKNGKILFHSSCVVNAAGEAFLFFGHSGAGKTTISQLCDGEVLGDDMNLLSVTGNQVFVEAATVGGRYFDKKNFGTRYPVYKAFWLHQDGEIFAQRAEMGSMNYLLSSFAGLFWDRLSAADYKNVYTLVRALRNGLRIYHLNFSLNRGVWDYVQSFEQNIQQEHAASLAEL